MRRDDLTTEELRLERLLQTLTREPAAPDPEFLRTLREASTQAFLNAHANRPQPRRVQRAAPTDPALGRQLLRTVRVAMMSAVAVLLIMGSLPPSVFPSRGVELQVAIDNLRRNNSVEIEVQNGSLANSLTYSNDSGQELLTFKYPSGNVEVIEGNTAVFFNFAQNSIHPAPEFAELNHDVLLDKLLSSLNVNDPQVQTMLLSQRPIQVRVENGTRLYDYRLQTPAAATEGETLTVDATVDANTKSLVAMNSRVTDALGNVQFKANADVKGINRPLSAERLPSNPQIKEADRIALVEEVHGNALVYDFSAPRPVDEFAGGGLGGGANKWNSAAGVEQSDANRQIASAAMAAGTLVNDNSVPPTPAPAVSTQPSDAPASPEVAQAVPMTKKAAGADKADGVSLAPSEKIAAKDAPNFSRSIVQNQAANGSTMRAMKGQASPKSKPSEDTAQLKEETAPESVRPGKNAPRNPGAPQSVAATPPAPTLAPSPPAPAEAKTDPLMVENSPPPAPAPKTEATAARRSRADSPVDVAQATIPSQATAQTDNNTTVMKQRPYAFGTQNNAKSAGTRMSNGAEGLEIARNQAAFDTKNVETANGIQQLNQLSVRNQRLRIGEQLAGESAGYQLAPGAVPSEPLDRLSYGIASRLVEEKSELRPGQLLKTGDDPSDIVRAKLANDANLIVGPGSEVLLIKPTEVRLRYGELLLEVPPKDQVDLLGPEPETWQEQGENYKGSYRRAMVQKGAALRRQVTGRVIFRVEKNQLTEVGQQPEWLAKYYASDNAKGYPAKTETVKEESRTQTRQSQSGYQVRDANRPAKPPTTKQAGSKK